MARHSQEEAKLGCIRQKPEGKLVHEGGATRTDDVTCDYSLIPQVILDTLAGRFTLGSISHGPNNWKEGGFRFILSCFSRYESHKSRLLYGDGKDDDLAAMMWNICVLAWFRKNKPMEYEMALEFMK